MPISPHLLSTTLLLTLLQYLHLASSQTAAQSSPSPSSAATSSLPTASTANDLPSYSFTYPVFPDHYNTGIQVSYKDTIDVAWVANGDQHEPVLQIQCWDRNDSSSFICACFIHPCFPVPFSYLPTTTTVPVTMTKTDKRTTTLSDTRLPELPILHRQPKHIPQPHLPAQPRTLPQIQPLRAPSPGPRPE